MVEPVRVRSRGRLTRAGVWGVSGLALLGLGACGGEASGPSGSEAVGSEDKTTIESVLPSATQPKGQRLQLEQRHPNGTVLRVSALDFGPVSGTFTVEAVNGYTSKVKLASRGVQLIDDKGTRYNFQKPEQNAELEVMPGGTLNGKLTFLGIIDRQATSLRLLVNAGSDDKSVDLAARSDSSTTPAFQFDLPVAR